MKHYLLYLGLFTTCILNAQLQVNSIQVATNDLVYDSVTDRIYVSIPSSNGSNGNSIGIINPNTYTLENTVFIGSEPTVLAISDNGQYIYAGFTGSSTVRRFEVTSQTAGLQFTIGSDPFFGAYYAEDIEVMPGNPNTIAVSRRRPNVTPTHGGVAIFDDNVMRPTTTPDHNGSNKIEFINSNSLVGYNNETSEFGLRKLSVNSGGVTNVSVHASVLTGYSLDFIYNENKVYATNGVVVDIASTPFVIGQFSNVYGPVAYDNYYNRVCFASYDGGGTINFKRYNPDTFLLFDSLPITQATGSVKNLTTCGNGCYAFNTTDNKVIIIKDPTLGTPEFESENKISIYPNPTVDYISVKSEIDIKEIKLFDLNGRFLTSFNYNNDKLFLGNFKTGVYFAQIRDVNGIVITKKIIKQ